MACTPWSGVGLRVVLAAELRDLGASPVTGLLDDRRDVGIGQELLEARRVPVEEDPDAFLTRSRPYRARRTRDDRAQAPGFGALLESRG